MESFEQESKPDITDLCILCKTMECCPEHCCNWDSCTCTDCEHCRANKNQQSISLSAVDRDPNVFMKSTGAESVTKIGTKKKITGEQSEKPQEQVRASDGLMIINYEVAQEEELVYAGGIKGIRALRHQREQLDEDIEQTIEQHRNRFGKYEEKKE